MPTSDIKFYVRPMSAEERERFVAELQSNVCPAHEMKVTAGNIDATELETMEPGEVRPLNDSESSAFVAETQYVGQPLTVKDSGAAEIQFAPARFFMTIYGHQTGGLIGELYEGEAGQLHFEGEAAESAKVFLDQVISQFVGRAETNQKEDPQETNRQHKRDIRKQFGIG